MKKADDEQEDEMRAEYDLSQLKGRARGKYAERYRKGTSLVLLEPDVAAAFPVAKSVNEAFEPAYQSRTRAGLAAALMRRV